MEVEKWLLSIGSWKPRGGQGMMAAGAGSGNPLKGMMGLVPLCFQRLVNRDDWSALAARILV